MGPLDALPESILQRAAGPGYHAAPFNAWGRPVGQPLVFAGPSGPVLVVTFDFGLIDGDYARVLGVEAVVLRRVDGLEPADRPRDLASRRALLWSSDDPGPNVSCGWQGGGGPRFVKKLDDV